MSKTWKDLLPGFTFVSCSVVDVNTVVLTANYDETYDGPNKPEYGNRLFFCDLTTGTWGGKHNDPGFRFARCAGGRTAEGQPQALFADAGGNITSFIFPDGPRDMEDEMPVSGAKRLAFVGDHFYACGMRRSFLRRNGPGDWTVFSDIPNEDKRVRQPGNFVALDGLAENDIYLALQKNDLTPHGQIMHWDGTDFTPIPLPDDVTKKARDFTMFITDLIVAPDGRVFVAGKDGELLVGGTHGFVNLTGRKRQAISMQQLCWFKGTLYGGHGVGLFRFDFDQRAWIGAPFVGDPQAPVGGPYIDANEDIMVFAGAYTASVYDGEKWTRIAGDVTPLDVTRLQIMEQQAEDLEELRDVLRDLSEEN